MFGLMILLALGVWVLITIIAIVIGAKLAGGKGAFAGFMLTMGGFIVYWIGEYIYIQHTATKLCKAVQENLSIIQLEPIKPKTTL